jgi:glycosyltransferase involved in cell wall biosynthesis
MPTPSLSVVICTHDPRPAYLERVLDALRAQTLPHERWELVMVDNASAEPLAAKWDLAWQRNARHVREDELGLTPARLRGIREAAGEVIVFIDDDNVAAQDYLEEAERVAAERPDIGAFGGSITGEFEAPLPAWIGPYLAGLGVSPLERDYWSNLPGWSLATPYGAGLCVRRAVAHDYLAKVASNRRRRALDRVGRALTSGGDTDLAWCALDLGLGTGRFGRMQLTHLIPAARLTEEYVTRLFAGFAAANEILGQVRAHDPAPTRAPWSDTARFAWRYARASGIEKEILLATRRALREARELLREEAA